MALTRNKMANQHDFAMIPRSDIPRSRYLLEQSRKTTFNGTNIVPIYCEEVLPGDHFNAKAAIFARMATPITPVMDNAVLETFFFFVPNRLTWEHWEDFIAGGNYVVPHVTSPAGGFIDSELADMFGIPPQNQTSSAINVNALPFRAYNLIYNEWFRDQNLMAEAPINTDDGPDPSADYQLLNRAKKHDYFTGALPWPQKGTAVTLPLGTQAPIATSTTNFLTGAQEPLKWARASDGGQPLLGNVVSMITDGGTRGIMGPTSTAAATGVASYLYPSNLYADLSNATAATINAIRTAFQIQRLLERDARGGSRYTEQIQSHFGVRPPDYRLQRPEYIGGGRSMVNTHPVAQTSSTDATTPQGNLAAFTTITGGSGHKFQYAATEHGYIIGLCNVRADLTYQQGLRRHWSRTTRYDYYFPVFAHLGEQAVLNKEIFITGNGTTDTAVFGYQERWAEYRYTPNEICGLFRSTATNTIDVWHYSEEFATQPALNETFITDPSYNVFQRSMAVGEEAGGQQILLDLLVQNIATRPMPTYSVPGLIDHF